MTSTFSGWSFMVGVLLAALDTIGSAVNFGTTAINTILQFSIVREGQVDLLFVSFSFPVPNTAWYGAWADLFTFNQWLLSGWASWIRLTVFLALLAAFLSPILVQLFAAALSAVTRRITG